MEIPLVSMPHLVPDRSKTSESQRSDNRQTCNRAEGVDRPRRDKPGHHPLIREERGVSASSRDAVTELGKTFSSPLVAHLSGPRILVISFTHFNASVH